MSIDYESMTIGASAAGLTTFLEELKVDYIDKARDELESGLTGVKEALDAGWQGESKDKFFQDLTDNANVVRETLEAEYTKLNVAITSTAQSFFTQDAQLMD